MNTTQFEAIVNEHSLCPGKKLYNAVALAGEAGEVCNEMKKMHMANLNPEYVTQEENSLLSAADCQYNLKAELGDVLFYLTRLALDNGLTLQEVMIAQKVKLDLQNVKYKRVFLK